ncbi:hypothetical protein G6F57_003038 [Rhizopus arrhizus]|uniref:Arrestin C-terminal-like domain-containing protein n=1 Tax=Rhizopus oryzae TaxID=64495 RepID=A0A9P6XFI1_RHIOR|nr:hypothetical protein G6F23_006350 [Rhizopus arrhizus]KAG1427377.1 hypothetical protein G6F58_001053 [Rhizopus delemar]KAG0767485.1 hypothetical protein G6F24_002745 [Rhizopus arrhizus]KAG0794068.1 hypothetical protein G6F21_003149 [Rhizopus arrhizus]KAG0801890.1 hypothetical protein G6F22_000799 [Rhizopus arrhizus]
MSEASSTDNDNLQKRRESMSVPVLSVEFDGGTHVIIRPNRVIRGKVILINKEILNITRIRIKFRAEEIATVKIDEGGADSKGDWIHEMITTFFDIDWKLFGQESLPYSQCGWEEVEPGRHEYPFALKFPNVNFPPSMDEPAGFGIRYIWSAQADGPALQSGIKSKDYITPYRPIIVSTPDKEWVYKTTVTKEKKALVEVQAKLDKQTYCPDETFQMQLNMTMLHSDSKITNISYKFRKHHEGKMLVQQGTAFRESVRVVLQDSVQITPNKTLSQPIEFVIPTRLVSPSFTSRHTRVHYDICIQAAVEQQGHLFKSNYLTEFTIPLAIANLPYDQLLRVSHLTSIKDYRQSKECPLFFDPQLDEPPLPQGLPSELIGPLTSALLSSTPANTNGEDQPPSYFSLPELPPQFEIRKERNEKQMFLQRQARGSLQSGELIEATLIPGLFDEDW